MRKNFNIIFTSKNVYFYCPALLLKIKTKLNLSE